MPDDFPRDMEDSAEEPAQDLLLGRDTETHEIQLALVGNGNLVASYKPIGQPSVEGAEIARRLSSVIVRALGNGGAELTTKIKPCLDVGNHRAAAALVVEARTNGVFSLPVGDDLLDVLRAIDVGQAPREDGRIVLRCIVGTAEALKRYESGREAAEALLLDAGAKFTIDERASFESFKAVALIKANRPEAGLAILRKLSQQTDLSASDRAWVWRNISLALESGETEAVEAAQRSADAFLEAGDKPEAARSLARVVECTIKEEPRTAVKTFDRILNMIDAHDIYSRALRSSVLHESAQMLSRLEIHREALARAMEAAKLRDGLVGQEAARVASLHLARFAAIALGDTASAEKFYSEARELESRLPGSRTHLADRMYALFRSYSNEAAAALSKDAKEAGDFGIGCAVALAIATSDPDLSSERKIELIEEQLNNMPVERQAFRSLEPIVLTTLARLLREAGEDQRAIVWLRRAHESDPLDFAILSQLLQQLWNSDRWGEAIPVIEKQIERLGEKPGLVFAHARSLLENGDISAAIPRLQRALALANTKETKAFILSLLERAYTLPNPTAGRAPADRRPAAVALDEVRDALRWYVTFVSEIKRMRFWTRKGGDAHSWREHPEQFAQDLLHLTLASKFGNRAEILEEIPAGAGRIDVLVRFHGGLTVMLELKICGGSSYSSTYAAAGEKQLTHYMSNRRTHIGFLLVIDGRIRDFGKPFHGHEDAATGPHTIEQINVDVRPKIG